MSGPRPETTTVSLRVTDAEKNLFDDLGESLSLPFGSWGREVLVDYARRRIRSRRSRTRKRDRLPSEISLEIEMGIERTSYAQRLRGYMLMVEEAKKTQMEIDYDTILRTLKLMREYAEKKRWPEHVANTTKALERYRARASTLKSNHPAPGSPTTPTEKVI